MPTPPAAPPLSVIGLSRTMEKYWFAVPARRPDSKEPTVPTGVSPWPNPTTNSLRVGSEPGATAVKSAESFAVIAQISQAVTVMDWAWTPRFGPAPPAVVLWLLFELGLAVPVVSMSSRTSLVGRTKVWLMAALATPMPEARQRAVPRSFPDETAIGFLNEGLGLREKFPPVMLMIPNGLSRHANASHVGSVRVWPRMPAGFPAASRLPPASRRQDW